MIALYGELINKATEEIRDRLEYGDCRIDPKTKEVQRVPVKAKDIAAIQAILFDKREVLRNLPTRTVRTTTENRLEEIKARMEALAQPRKYIDSVAEQVE